MEISTALVFSRENRCETPHPHESARCDFEWFDGMTERLSAVVDRFAPQFHWRNRSMLASATLYIHGLFQANRRNMERMSEVVSGADAQSLHHFTGNSPWRARAVFDQVAREADAVLGGQDDSCLLVDESSFAKKGEHSAGAARQWLGRHGKVDNGQVGVFAALANGSRHTLIDAQLYLPSAWTDDPGRCLKAGVPKDEIKFRSKAQMALEMTRRARANGVRYKWVGMDAGYGKEPWLLRELNADGEVFIADVTKKQAIYLTEPDIHQDRVRSYTGPARMHRKTPAKPVQVGDWVAQQTERAWRSVALRDGERGKLVVKILHRRVWLWDKEEEKAHCWHLIVREDNISEEKIKYTLSNAPEETTLRRLAAMQCARFWIERSFQDGKSTVGMADYQVRRWDAWRRHMALVMIAMFFMLTERLRQREQMPLLSCGDIVDILKLILPSRVKSKKDIAALILRRHKKRQSSIDSYCRRQKKLLE